MLRISSALALAASIAAQNIPEIEPNFDSLTATPTAVTTQNYGSIQPAGDNDWWSFSLAQDAYVVIHTTSRGAGDAYFGTGTSLDDTILTLFQSDGATPIATNDDHLGTGHTFGEVLYFSKIETFLTAAGSPYYVRVVGWNSLDYFGDYALDITIGSQPAPLTFCSGFTTGTAEVEPNDDNTSTNPVLCCETVSGNIGTATDEDWFQFVVGAQTEVLVDVLADPASATPIADPLLSLADSDGDVFLISDDANGTLFPQFTRQLEPGVYFLVVSEAVGGTGDYLLQVDCANATTTWARADVDSDSSGCVGSTGTAMQLVRRYNEFPTVGSVFSFDIVGSPVPPVMLVGFVPYDPEIDLGVIGFPGCLLSVQQVAPALPTTPTVMSTVLGSPGQEYEFNVGIPLDPGNIGIKAYFQAAGLDGASLVTSDRLTATIGDDT